MQQVPTVPCDAFRKNPDGSWACIKPVTIRGPAGEIKISPGLTFRKGVYFMGIDLATLLDQQCS